MARNKRRMSRGKRDYDRKDDRNERCDNARSPREDSARNDISWYSRNPNLLIAAGSFPYPYRPGMQVDFGQQHITGEPANWSGNRKYRIPGVAVLDWMPTVGYSGVATDPASIAAKEIYAKVRDKYSGNLDADAPDYIVYLMALDSIFSYIAWLKRLYRVMNAWTPENYVLPDTVLCAMGFGSEEILSLRQNRMQLWQIINELVLQSRKFTCPASMDIFNRHYWMSDNVYTDDPNINSQFYMFNLKAVFKYGQVTMPDGNPGPGLVMTPMPTLNKRVVSGKLVPLTVEDLYTFGRGLIDALVAWDDAYTINGYLMRAYEGTPQFIVDELPADQPFNPVYEPEVLAQIENSRAIPYGSGITDFSGFNVSQSVDTNAVLSNPTYSVSTSTDPQYILMGKGYTIPPVLSSRNMTPTVADSVIASRLQAAVTATEGTGTISFQVHAGTEIPIAWRTRSGVIPTNGAALIFSDTNVHQLMSIANFTDATSTQNNSSIFALANLLQFEAYDWHPFSFITMLVGTTEEPRIDGVYVAGDTHNITVTTIKDLENLHKVCVYSEFNAFSL